MATESNPEYTILPPDEAFSTLGNEIRMEILQMLGESPEPVTFSDLRDRVGVSDSGQFNYHLDKLGGHFIVKSNDGYELSNRGRRVVQSILSGAVTADPAMSPTEIEEYCYHCGTEVLVDYYEGRVGIFCPECGGNYGLVKDIDPGRFSSDQLEAELGHLGNNKLPPAGVQNRRPIELLKAAVAWSHHTLFSYSADLCPRCSAPLDVSVNVCETHDSSDGLCDDCGFRRAVIYSLHCTNCIHSSRGIFVNRILGNPHFLKWLLDHGLNPIAPESPLTFWRHVTPYDEEIHSVEPFEGRFTFTIEGDSISLTVDDNLQVVDVD